MNNMELQYKEGDTVYYKGKKYLIRSVMESEYANWSYSISPKLDSPYNEVKTIWRGNEDMLTNKQVGQLKFEL